MVDKKTHPKEGHLKLVPACESLLKDSLFINLLFPKCLGLKNVNIKWILQIPKQEVWIWTVAEKGSCHFLSFQEDCHECLKHVRV